uniref:Uncharacterized protein n=1 Tax=Pseudonaja textilis TaxID=8673 RepID=A0A670Z3S5_PSETE
TRLPGAGGGGGGALSRDTCTHASFPFHWPADGPMPAQAPSHWLGRRGAPAVPRMARRPEVLCGAAVVLGCACLLALRASCR